MLTSKKLEILLKRKYGIAVGEMTLEEVKRKLIKISNTKIKISGRSYKTGKKNTINVHIKELLN